MAEAMPERDSDRLKGCARVGRGTTQICLENTSMAIHVHKSGEMGIFANAYAVETEDSLIVIDATLTRSEALAFGQILIAIRKPVAAVLITHAHPDHVAGLRVWLANPDTPVYALASVGRLLRAIEEQSVLSGSQFSRMNGSENGRSRTD